MAEENNYLRFSSFREFIEHRKKKNDQTRKEWDEIYSMTYDTLIEVLNEMAPDQSTEKQQQETENTNEISTKSF